MHTTNGFANMPDNTDSPVIAPRDLNNFVNQLPATPSKILPIELGGTGKTDGTVINTISSGTVGDGVGSFTVDLGKQGWSDAWDGNGDITAGVINKLPTGVGGFSTSAVNYGLMLFVAPFSNIQMNSLVNINYTPSNAVYSNCISLGYYFNNVPAAANITNVIIDNNSIRVNARNTGYTCSGNVWAIWGIN